MAVKILGAQRDFSFGEVDVALKRNDDHPARKGGLRQMANARILNSGALQDRSGRSALYPITNGGRRTERFTISAGNVFDIQFAAGRLKIINSAGVTVANFTTQGNGAALPWASNADIQSIVYVLLNLTMTICFGHGMRPQVITWDGVSTWSIADYAEAIVAGGQKRTPFYRISPQNVTLVPSAISGVVNVVFSSDILVAGHVGTRFRFCGRQLQILTVTGTKTGTAIVIETLPPGQQLTASNAIGTINIGDVLIGIGSGAKGIVTSTASQQTISWLVDPPKGTFLIGDSVSGGTSGATGIVTSVDTKFIIVSLSTGTLFAAAEVVTGPHGNATSLSATAGAIKVQLLQNASGTLATFGAEGAVGQSGSIQISAAATIVPQPVAVWDDEVMNNYRGYPAAVFTDQFRLGFCNFASVPGGIGWSSINNPTDLYVGANPSDAMFEIAPAKVQVYFVVPGPESSEFVFTDRRVYYIPISPTNPLKPGSVQFAILSGDGAAQVQPRLSQEAILYINAGQNSVMAVIATGAYLRPFNTKNLCEFHAHLFNSIQCLAAPSADGTFNERYAYVLNGDGSIAVGKYNADSLAGNAPVVGWGPWSGGGVVSWIAAQSADVLFTTTYFGAAVCEILDDSQYLDCALPVNSAPAAFAPPGGKGPLWFIPSQSVTLIDQVTRAMGTYQIDVNGFIVPQFNGGEDLTIASLVAGQPWTMTVEPFCPAAQPGSDINQRMNKRQISRFAVWVIQSTGFMLSRLFSGPITSTSPALGTLMAERRFPAWNTGDDATKPPPLRETVEDIAPPGSNYDPRVALIKDTPGPLQILELAIEVSV